jgi:hypothetical protein
MDKELKNIVKTALIMTIVMAVVGLSIKDAVLYIGLMMGAIISIGNFYLLERDIKKIVKSGDKAPKYAFSGYMKRYMITIIVIGAFGMYFKEAVVAMIPGLFLVKISIYLNQIIKYIKAFIKERR